MKKRLRSPCQENTSANIPVLLSGVVDGRLGTDIATLYFGDLPNGWRAIRSSSGNRVYTDGAVFLKIFVPVSQLSLNRRARALLLGSSDLAAIKADRRMSRNGMNVPVTLAHGQIGDSRFVVTQRVPGATLYDIVTMLTAEKRHSLARALAREVSRMHAKHIRHGDLNPYNIIVSTATSGSWTFCFLDNDKNRFLSYGKGFRLTNLSQLNFWGHDGRISVTDRIRFLEAYLDCSSERKLIRPWASALNVRFNKRLKKKLSAIQ